MSYLKQWRMRCHKGFKKQQEIEAAAEQLAGDADAEIARLRAVVERCERLRDRLARSNPAEPYLDDYTMGCRKGEEDAARKLTAALEGKA